MPIEQHDLAGAIAFDASQNAAVGVDDHLVESPLIERLLHPVYYAIFMTRITLALNKRLAQSDKLLAPFCCHHH